jgi:hypothetical protein
MTLRATASLILCWLLAAVGPALGAPVGTPDNTLIVNNTPTTVYFLIGSEPTELSPNSWLSPPCVKGLIVTMKTSASVVSWQIQCGTAYAFVFDEKTGHYQLLPFQPGKGL